MQHDAIFKTLKTYGYPYVYDRHTNALIVLTEEEYCELLRVERGELPLEQCNAAKRFREFGMFEPNSVETIEHGATVIIEQYIETRIKQLILQVTQQCNLRCGYCSYSGKYMGQRSHANERMSFQTAKKAIDFFLERNNELPEVTISFYGGEPLLEIELIKQCVRYANEQVEGKRIKFNTTTNGTLLSDDVVDFLVENDFSVGISLDGSKEEHDKNRKFSNGGGSFDIIISNVKRLIERYPDYINNISFMTTINPHASLECVMEYFSSEEIFNDRNIIFNNMKESHYEGDIVYEKSHYAIRNYEYIKMLFAMVGKLDTKHVSPLVGRARSAIERRQREFVGRVAMPRSYHHGGPCLPGVMRLFVRVDGALFPCERVGELLDFFVIGTLEDGFDIAKIKSMLNIGKLTEDECKMCWGLRQCLICAGQLQFEESLTKEDKIKECKGNLNTAMADLYELCVLNEFGYDVEDDMVQ